MALAAPAGAQRGPLGAAPDSPAARADSLAMRGDTTAALALLDSAVRANKRDAVSWYLYGLLNWELARKDRNPSFMRDRKAIRYLSAADTALRLATQFAPDSARYWLALGTFNRQSGLSTTRFAAVGQVNNAVDAATKVGDGQLLAQASDMSGVTYWIRYEASANRALLPTGQTIQLATFNNWDRNKARDYVNTVAAKIDPPTGTADYEAALQRFERAVEYDSTNLRYSRHLYMALATRNRWDELAAIARRRARQFPLDYQAQLALGMALHRLEKPREAQRAYDSAFVLMDDGERDYLTRFTRILRPTATKYSKDAGGDSASFSKLPAAQRQGLEKMYWYMNDPLTLTAENEYRLEFLSRVVFAEFRWTDEDIGYRGADTDRGDVYVRYGPPDLELSVPGGIEASNITIVWAYDNGLVFFFDLTPGFGTARASFADRDNQNTIMNARPVTWDNIPGTRLIDTIPIRVARFRAAGDSTDAVVAVRMPFDSLVKSLDIDRVPVDVDFRVFDQFVRVQGLESSQVSVVAASPDSAARRVWFKRLGPGINLVRVEALQSDSRRAARAMTQLMPEATRGYGMSDILLGSRPEPRGDGAPARWRDVAITPSEGTFASGAPIGMVWELYDLAARDGQHKYQVNVLVERVDRSSAAKFALRVVDGVGRAVGREASGSDKITVSFERTAAASPTLVEYFSLNMPDAPSGRYRLRMEIVDRANQRRISKVTEFVIR
jgi:GWxTD domain-containing protein